MSIWLVALGGGAAALGDQVDTRLFGDMEAETLGAGPLPTSGTRCQRVAVIPMRWNTEEPGQALLAIIGRSPERDARVNGESMAPGSQAM